MTTATATLVLTPECHSLWTMSPGLFLLYDRVLLDRRDFEFLANPQDDSPYAVVRASAVGKLRSWGVIEPVDYGAHLPSEIRSRIASHAVAAVSSLSQTSINEVESRFRQRALHAHREYQKYIENVISVLPRDDVSTKLLQSKRWELVDERIRCLESLRVSESMLEQIAWTLERVYAKAQAGLIVAGRIPGATLYDTDEYRPFVASMLADVSHVGYFDPTAVLAGYHVLLAALADKAVPELTMADDYRLFERLRSHDDIRALRRLLRRVEGIFGRLVRERQDLVRESLSRELVSLEIEYERQVQRARERLGPRLGWRGMQSVAGKVAGWLRPWLDEVRQVLEKRTAEETRARLPAASDMAADLFMVSEIWRRWPPPPVPDRRDRQDEPMAGIWGSGDRRVPWYEIPENELTRP